MLLERIAGNTPTEASPAPIEPTSGCPISRRYESAAAGTSASELKFHALVTTVAAPKRGCRCVVPRRWDLGMEPAAEASIRAAIGEKEAIALSQHAAFGVAPEAVPTQARTIFFRTAWRSFDEQVCLRSNLGAQAEVPGWSRHEWGIAVDLEDWDGRGDSIDEQLLLAHGWCRTNGEGWHYEFRPALIELGQTDRCL